MTGQDATALLGTALRAALPAADAIMRIYEEGNWDVEVKADKSPLTRADREAHDRIVEVLERETSQVPILSEEGSHLPFETRREWHRLWVVDPLDGTKEFLSRNGEFTVNVALVEDGTPVLGVVGVPALDTYYLAVRDHGAYRASRAELEAAAAEGDVLSRLSASAARLSAAPAPAPAGGAGDTGAGETGARETGAAPGRTARIVASRSHLNAETDTFIEKLRTRHGELELVQAGSAVKLCRVAEGQADYYPRLAPTMEWDTAAGDAVVREAGGRVFAARADGSTDEQELTYNKEDLHNPYFIAVGQGLKP